MCGNTISKCKLAIAIMNGHGYIHVQWADSLYSDALLYTLAIIMIAILTQLNYKV